MFQQDSGRSLTIPVPDKIKLVDHYKYQNGPVALNGPGELKCEFQTNFPEDFFKSDILPFFGDFRDTGKSTTSGANWVRAIGSNDGNPQAPRQWTVLLRMYNHQPGSDRYFFFELMFDGDLSKEEARQWASDIADKYVFQGPNKK